MYGTHTHALPDLNQRGQYGLVHIMFIRIRKYYITKMYLFYI